jgi:hypothetical protein
LDLTYRRMLLLVMATLASMVVGVATSAASGAGAIGPNYCPGRGLLALEEGALDPREPLTVQQHEPQDGTAEVTGRESAEGHC